MVDRDDSDFGETVPPALTIAALSLALSMPESFSMCWKLALPNASIFPARSVSDNLTLFWLYHHFGIGVCPLLLVGSMAVGINHARNVERDGVRCWRFLHDHAIRVNDFCHPHVLGRREVLHFLWV